MAAVCAAGPLPMMATLVWSFSTVMVAEERRRAEAEVGSPKADVGAHAAVAVKRTLSELFNTRRMNQQADKTEKTPANVCAGAGMSPCNVSVFLYFQLPRVPSTKGRADALIPRSLHSLPHTVCQRGTQAYHDPSVPRSTPSYSTAAISLSRNRTYAGDRCVPSNRRPCARAVPSGVSRSCAKSSQ